MSFTTFDVIYMLLTRVFVMNFCLYVMRSRHSFATEYSTRKWANELAEI